MCILNEVSKKVNLSKKKPKQQGKKPEQETSDKIKRGQRKKKKNMKKSTCSGLSKIFHRYLSNSHLKFQIEGFYLSGISKKMRFVCQEKRPKQVGD